MALCAQIERLSRLLPMSLPVTVAPVVLRACGHLCESTIMRAFASVSEQRE